MKPHPINLVVIADVDCPTTYGYLQYMRIAGFVPADVLWIRFFPTATARSGGVGARLRNQVRSRGDLRRIRERRRVGQLAAVIQSNSCLWPINMGVLRRSVPRKLLEVESFSDDRLISALIRYQDCAFLYTGGGMVPETLLGAAGLRILHIHPGWVPELRGSDGMLWSSLLRSELTASLFYMSLGIDEGELIARASAPLPRVDFGDLLAHRWTEAQIYSALLATVDPHLRGLLLVSVLQEFKDHDLRFVPSHPQPKWNSPPLLWMHPEIRRLAYYHWDSEVESGMNSGLTTDGLRVEFMTRHRWI